MYVTLNSIKGFYGIIKFINYILVSHVYILYRYVQIKYTPAAT